MMLIQQVLTADPPYPHDLKRGIPRDIETICLKAMAKEPLRRYQTAKLMEEDLQRFIEGRPILTRPVSRIERAWRWVCRNPVIAGSATTISILLILAGSLFWRERSLSATILPLQGRERELSAKLQPLIHTVKIATEPAGANVVFIPLHSSSGEPQPELGVKMSSESIELSPGIYLVVAYTDQNHFHEVYRRVPVDLDDLPHALPQGFWKKLEPGVMELRPVAVVDQSTSPGMSRFEGNDDFVAGSAKLLDAPQHHRRVPPFYLDAHEISVGEFLRDFSGFDDGLGAFLVEAGAFGH